MSAEASHYVVTAHPPGGVLLTATCNFLSSGTTSATNRNVIVAKSRRLEVRQAQAPQDSSSPFPVVLTLPINGRITSMVPLRLPRTPTDYLFITTDRYRYAVISHSPESTPYPTKTHASGSLRGVGREAAVGPLVSVDPHGRCLVLHLYDGLLTVIPIHLDYYYYCAPASAKQPPHPGFHHPHRHNHNHQSLLGEPYHLRLEERAILDLVFLHTSPEKQPHLCLLHQDSRSAQHVVAYTMDMKKKQLSVAWKRGRVDGGSSMLLAVPPVLTTTAASASASAASTTARTSNNAGVVVVVGQRQITYLGTGISKVVPMPCCLVVSATYLPHARFLLGDEFGNLHILTIQSSNNGIELETLGSCVISSSLAYIQDGLVFVASQFGDSQLVQIHQEPVAAAAAAVPTTTTTTTTNETTVLDALSSTTYLEIVEEYTNLGPITDFDLVPTHAQQQSQVVTCSGSSTSGSIRLIRNGIGMNECASVEMEGIQNLWNIRKEWGSAEDAYLVQSFVGETRVLGVVASTTNTNNNAMMEQDDDDDDEESGGTLEEVVLEGLDSTASSLHVGNVQVGNSILQITESELRLISASSMQVTATWSPEGGKKSITVASANEAGQIIVSLRGGVLLYLRVADASKIELVATTTLEREVSCVDLRPFVAADVPSAMMVDVVAPSSNLVAVGLWDDFTVRLLSLDSDLNEVLHVNLGLDDDDEVDNRDGVTRRTRNNMMARSLCLITLDSTNAISSSGSVDMLFVGLGDGTLISFAVLQRDGHIGIQSRKEVSLGTQRINLVPLQTEQGGRCVLATGDRPTVIYLAGGGGGGTAVSFSNPKLCYSNVNLSASDTGDDDDVNRPPAQQSIAVNVATPFVSPHLFDTTSVGSKHFSICVSDDSNLRLGIIDDIQKLHVTTCRLGMAPRRVVHCSQDRMFAVGCIESGLTKGGSARDEVNMGNCIRFLDDTTFDDIERIDMEPFEMILSMVYANLGPTESPSDEDALSSMGGQQTPKGESNPYLLIGTGYALPDEDEPTRGRIIVMSCSSVGLEENTRKVRHVTELQVRGGVYALCQFYNHKVLATVNSKTQVCELSDDGTGAVRLSFVGIGHHGHILSLFVKSKATRTSSSKSKALKEDETLIDNTPTKKKPRSNEQSVEQLAIVGDLMRSISLVRYYPEHKALEEIARDFNANWTTAIEMLTDDIYLGAENWNHLYVLRRNAKANSEEVRCRLDTIGEFHLGEMCNKFMCGSLIMPHHGTSSSVGRRKVALRMTPSPASAKGSGRDKKAPAATRAFRPTVSIGTQTLFATVDGTLGSILGLDAHTAAFFKTLERAMAKTITPVGDLSHDEFRAFNCERRVHPSHGFIDGDLVESFLDLDRPSMEAVVKELNRDGGWDIDNFAVRNQLSDDDGADEAMENELELAVEDVLSMVEEMTMFH